MTNAPQHQDHRERMPVSWFELFYDLVMVAALVSMNDSFLTHPNVISAATASASAASLFTVWLLSTMAINRFPSDGPTRRILLVAVMACVVVAALAVDQQEGLKNEYGLIAYGLALYFVAAIYLFAPRGRKGWLRAEVMALSALAVAGTVSIVGSFAPADLAWAFLTLATVIAIIPMATVYESTINSRHPLEPRHLSERMGLFILMVLGLSFGQLVVDLSGTETIPDIRFFILMFVLMFALWWMYFGLQVQEHPVLITSFRHVWIAAHYLLLIGIAGIGDVVSSLSATTDGDPLVDGAAYLGTALALALIGYAILLATLDGIGHVAVALLLTMALLLLAYNVVVDIRDAQDLRLSTLLSAVLVILLALALGWLRRRDDRRAQRQAAYGTNPSG